MLLTCTGDEGIGVSYEHPEAIETSIMEADNNVTKTFMSELDESTTMVPDHQAFAVQLNDEMRKVVLPVTIFVGIEILLGFFGNLLILYVFLFRYHVCNFRYFVLCLAFVDITSSLTTMPGEIVTQLYWYIYPVPAICKVKSFFNAFTVSVQAFGLLTIAIDRYLKVCRPFGWQIKPKVAIILCVIIYFCALILALPVPIFWGTHSYKHTYMNTTIEVTVCEKDEQFEHTNKPLHYSLSFEIIVSVCLFIMFILYILVARRLFQDKRAKKGHKITNKEITPLSTMMPGAPTDLSSNRPSALETSHDLPSKVLPSIESESSDNCLSSGAEEPSLSSVKPTQNEKSSYPVLSDTDDGYTSGSDFGFLKKDGKLTPQSGTHMYKKSNRLKRISKQGISKRVKRKTLIMFILTIVFILTTILYLTLLSFIARSDDILQNMGPGGKAIYFFFFRLYFINHAINPVVYGILDPKFRKVMSSFRLKRSHD
ncbi:hypothetical protein ACF0H5_009782 [Mactra antiquata]